MQIITNFAKVLNVTFPEDVRALLKALDIFRFDLSMTIGIGCLYNDSYFTSLGASFGLVVVVVLVVGATYLLSSSRIVNEKTNLRKIYAEFDEDGEGIVVGQVQAIAEKLQLLVSKDEIESMFVDADSDGSGRMNFDEFCAAFDANLGIREVMEKALRAKLRRDATGRLFLLIFLLYPSLTNKIFEIFLCRDLGPNTPSRDPASILHADYAVDCDDTYAFRWILGMMLVILWPIGIPAVLFAAMFQARPQILAEDEDAINLFGSVIGDYKPEYWYWEVVELLRKLLLSGILSLVNRGSIAQATFGTMISFVFFALHVRLLPYRSSALNNTKAVSELQLFVVLLTSVILQAHNVGFAAEVVQVDDYGTIQAAAIVLIIPVTVFLVVRTLAKLRAQDTTKAGMEVENPLAQKFSDDAFDDDGED